MSNSLVSQEKLVMLGEIASNIAHDLNTPIASIKAAIGGIQEVICELNARMHMITKEDAEILRQILALNEKINPYPRKSIIQTQSI